MLAGKTALVTGSAKGLGRRTALELAASGCDVALNYVTSREEAEKLADEIIGMGRKAVAIRADIARTEETDRLVGEVEQRLGGVDILINNAGPFIRERRLFADYSPEDIHYLMNGNLVGTMLLDHRVLPGMRSRGWGRIIHFVEEAASGITVNMICPGDIRGGNKEKTIADVAGVHDEESPRGRPGTGQDVARVILFLCQPESDFITGNTIDVSGGLDPIRATLKK
jgi:3-oxoacyl-[acyl-carrier protein] reductase